MNDLSTKNPVTWCPGCYNFQILSGIKNALKEVNTKEFAIVSGIGCHAKIFDYINLNGINTLHGRVLPTCLGIKVGNPNLNILGFSGDGDAYAEGMEHFIHAARFNSNFKYFVHNNQVFALTVGEPTPTTEEGFKDKTTPLGVKQLPINPIKLALAANASFVARVFADAKQIEWITKEALRHKGFAFVEIIQPCIIFHADIGYKDKFYNLQESEHDTSNMTEALKKADEFDYNKPHRIPMGIFYRKERETFEEAQPILQELMNKKLSWKNLPR